MRNLLNILFRLPIDCTIGLGACVVAVTCTLGELMFGEYQVAMEEYYKYLDGKEQGKLINLWNDDGIEGENELDREERRAYAGAGYL